MSQINLELHYKQGLYFQSTAKYTALVTGVGFGKSFIGAHKMLKMMVQYPKALHFIGANTHSQLTQTTLKTFFTILDESGITYVYNEIPPKKWGIKSKFKKNHDGVITLKSGIQVWTRPLHNFNIIRGQQIGYAWIDEVRDTKKKAFDMLVGRMRDENGPCCIDMTTTPDGFNWLYDIVAGDKPLKNSLLIQGNSRDNEKHLPDGYIDSMLDAYDDNFAKQEIAGQFVSMGEGQCYYSFDRLKNVSTDSIDDPDIPLIIGMDFNISPMTATIGIRKGDVVFLFDEITMNRSNTEEMAAEIKNRFPTWERRGLKIYPDATGNAGKTSSRGNYRSDHAILKAEFGQDRIHGAKSNPRQRDRITAVNNRFGLSKLFLHPQMKKTISSLEKTKYKDGSRFEIDKSQNTEHWSDALGYPIFRLFPIKDTHISGQSSWM